MKKKILFLLLLTIFIIFFILFVPKFIWGDEAWSGKVASVGIRSAVYYSLKDFHPPLYHILLSLIFYIFPEKALVGRLFSLFLGILSLYIIVFHLSKYIREEEAILLSILLVFSPFFLYIFTLVRMYPLLVLLSLISIYSFFSLIEDKKNSHLFVISNLSMLLTHHFALPLFLLEGLFFILEKFKKGIKLFFITVAFYLPFTYILFIQLRRRLTLSRGWGNITSASFFKDTFSFLFFNTRNGPIILTILFLFLIVVSFFKIKTLEDKFFTLYFIFYLSIFFFLSFIAGSIYFHYISILIIPTYYLLSKGIIFFYRFKEKILFFVLLFLFLFIPFSFLKGYPDIKGIHNEIKGKKVVFLNIYEEFRYTFGIKGDFSFLKDLPLNNFTFDTPKKIREGIEKLKKLKEDGDFIFLYTGVGGNFLSIYDPEGNIKRWLEANASSKEEFSMFSDNPIFLYLFKE